ncbi:MAG: phosphatase PAP2 family protein [Legionella longbeachae]|nr:phosphatase PAP2 family protein [Legionella longbeachae]
MNQVLSCSIIFFSGCILVLSSISILINHFIYKYPGNNYFPEGIPLLLLILILFNWGIILLFKKGSKLREIGKELIYFFAVMCLIALATNAVQLTPFPTIDKSIVSLESHLHINMEAILTWTHNHPQLKYLLSIIYNSLPYQMSILPLLVIATCRFHLLREYYFLLFSTLLIGFTFYYFFPTTAPASIINSPFFLAEQIDTGLKFRQIHQYIIPTTNQGGLIALPSFHTIWAIMCVYLLREWAIPCALLMIINILLIASCVLLGWHYCTDLIAGVIVLLICYYFLKRCETKQNITILKL